LVTLFIVIAKLAEKLMVQLFQVLLLLMTMRLPS